MERLLGRATRLASNSSLSSEGQPHHRLFLVEDEHPVTSADDGVVRMEVECVAIASGRAAACAPARPDGPHPMSSFATAMQAFFCFRASSSREPYALSM